MKISNLDGGSAKRSSASNFLSVTFHFQHKGSDIHDPQP
jgi:hypothetical protein